MDLDEDNQPGDQETSKKNKEKKVKRECHKCKHKLKRLTVATNSGTGNNEGQDLSTAIDNNHRNREQNEVGMLKESKERDSSRESKKRRHKHKHKSKHDSDRSPDRQSSSYSHHNYRQESKLNDRRESNSYVASRGSSRHRRHKRSEHRDYVSRFRRTSPSHRRTSSRSPLIENGKNDKHRYRSRSREKVDSNNTGRRGENRTTPEKLNRIRDANLSAKKRGLSPDYVEYSDEEKRKLASNTNGEGEGEKVSKGSNERGFRNRSHWTSNSDPKANHTKPGSPPKREVVLVSKSRTEFDIFWDENISGKKGDGSEDENTKVNLLVTTKSSSPFRCLSPKDSPRTPPSESLNMSDKGPSYLSPDKAPTPTQDESSEHNGFTNRSPEVQRIATLNIKSENPEAYDPEVPLESPDMDQSLSLDSPGSPYDPIDNDFKKSPVASEKSRSPVPRPKTPSQDSRASPLSPPKQATFSPSSFRGSSSHPIKSHSTSSISRSSPKTLLINSSKVPVPGSLLDQIQQTLNLSKRNLSSPYSKHSRLQANPSSHSSAQTPVSHQDNPHSSSFSNPVNVPITNERSSIPHSALSSTLNPSSTMSATLKTLLDSLIKAAEQQKHLKAKNFLSSDANNVFKKPAPVADKDSSQCRKPSPHSQNPSFHRHNYHHSVKTTVVNKSGSSISSGHALQTSSSSSGPNLGPRMQLSDLAVLDDVPSSAVELQVKEKYLKKLNRQERVIEEVKMVSKPFYQRKEITKEEYKEILRKAVPKICHSKSGEINPSKIRLLVEGYVKKFKHARKKNKALAIK